MGEPQMTAGLRRDKLPTDVLRALLDEHGLRVTWIGMLAALARCSHDSPAARGMLASPEYEFALAVEGNPLSGLSVGEIGVLYEFSLAHTDHAGRKAAGQYFTPDDVAQMLVREAIKLPGKTWLDPCCGVGNLAYWLTASQQDPEGFILEHLYCVDRDDTALLIARSLFTLYFYRSRADLFNLLQVKFLHGDFLTMPLPAYDNALANPPYVGVRADERFETAAARDTYAYFMERIAATATGCVIITPQSFTHGNRFETLRALLLRTYPNLHIYAFDNIPDSIFRGIKFGSTNTNQVNSTRAAVTVGSHAGNARKITPLLRWATAQRPVMLRQMNTFAEEAPLTPALFPKVGRNLIPLLLQTKSWPTLRTYLSAKPTQHRLLVPSTPRYFLPAVERHLERASAFTLYFENAATRDLLYPLLNTSLPYWWWRVCDGGMNLSRATLLSLPIPPDLVPAQQLVELLRVSEQTHLVTKMNAGKPNENIKHPPKLLQMLNVHYFGVEIGLALLGTQANSHLAADRG